MNSPRVVSLLPGATEILHALGLGTLQVGRSHECDFPACVKNLPPCTRALVDVGGSSHQIDSLVKQRLAAAVSIYAVDAHRLRELKPTHILTQTLCDVCAVSMADVEAAFAQENQYHGTIVPLSAGSLAGLWRDIQKIAKALDAGGRGQELISVLQGRLAAIEQLAQAASNRPRIAAIEWIEPLMAAGNWVPELIAMAAGENLFGSAGEHSPWMEWNHLQSADPDIIVSLPCGFDLPRTRQEMAVLSAKPEWNTLRAVRESQVYICDGNQFMNRPGPRLVESLQIFAEIFHPELFAPTLRATGWERLARD